MRMTCFSSPPAGVFFFLILCWNVPKTEYSCSSGGGQSLLRLRIVVTRRPMSYYAKNTT